MKNPNVILVGSVVFILLAVALVAILDKTSTGSGSSDVRARAGSKTTTALQLTGTVASTDETKRTLTVNSVQFAQKNLSGPAKDLGTFTVTAPSGFNFASVQPGTQVIISIDSATFQVTNRTVTALAIVAK